MSDHSALLRLMTPSWLSGLFSLSLAVLLTAAAVGIFLTNNLGLRQQLTTWQHKSAPTSLTRPGETVSTDAHPTVIESWPLILFWGVVGMLVYSIASYIIQVLNESLSFRKSLHYVNARPRLMIETLVEHVVLRLVASAVLLWLLIVSVKQIVPYCILAAHASSSDIVSLDGMLYALLSVAVLILTVHIDVIFLRLSLGKTRVQG